MVRLESKPGYSAEFGYLFWFTGYLNVYCARDSDTRCVNYDTIGVNYNPFILGRFSCSEGASVVIKPLAS